MIERAELVRNPDGLHVRPASEFVKVANRFRAEIRVEKDGLEVNGKSIMGVMMLAAEFGSTLVIKAEGEDAQAAVDALAQFVASAFEVA